MEQNTPDVNSKPIDDVKPAPVDGSVEAQTQPQSQTSPLPPQADVSSPDVKEDDTISEDRTNLDVESGYFSSSPKPSPQKPNPQKTENPEVDAQRSEVKDHGVHRSKVTADKDRLKLAMLAVFVGVCLSALVVYAYIVTN